MRKVNKILRISLIGGVIGMFTTNPRAALEKAIAKANSEGWNAIHIDSHRTTNLFISFLQLVVLFLTAGLYTWGGGYLVLLERDADD